MTNKKRPKTKLRMNERCPAKRSTATYADDPENPEQCHAARKSDGERCRRPIVPGQMVCRLHGGWNSGRPPIHGRYSRVMGKMAATYEKALEDSEGLLDLNETLAVLEAIVRRYMERASNEGDTPDFRMRALALYREAREANDKEIAGARLAELGRLLEHGASEDSVLEKLTTSVEKMAVRQEKAWSIKLSAAQAINARDLVALLGRVASIIVDEIEDPKDARRLLQRVDVEVMGGSSRLANAAHPAGPPGTV